MAPETEAALSLLSTNDTQGREELFPLLEEENEPITDVTHIVDRLRAIRYYQGLLAQFHEERTALMDRWNTWYDKRTDACQNRIDHHMRNIRNYMKERGLQKLPTPEGTPFFRDVTRFTWPDDENLVAWAKVNCPEMVEQRDVVNKNKIKRYIHDTGNAPPGYDERTEPTLNVKDAND